MRTRYVTNQSLKTAPSGGMVWTHSASGEAVTEGLPRWFRH